MSFLAKQDKHGRIRFTDIEDMNYDGTAAENGKIDYATGMRYMHAVKPDGQVIKGVEVIRNVYEVVGLGWLWSWTRAPIIGPVVERVYELWALYRTNLTRGEAVDEIIANRNALMECKANDAPICVSGTCEARLGMREGRAQK